MKNTMSPKVREWRTERNENLGRRIYLNVWDNWQGYEGRKHIEDFGSNEEAAKIWLKGETK